MRFWLQAMRATTSVVGVLLLALPAGLQASRGPAESSAVQSPGAREAAGALVQRYCLSCHSERLGTGGLVLEGLDAGRPGDHPEVWERVAEKLRAGSMPPPGRPRPDVETYHAVAGALEAELDRAWAANPRPGRIGAVHRLNRTEYANALRDLIALDPRSFDVRPLLPGDETADGSFDNFADVLTISRVNLERYLSVARQVTRLTTGLPPAAPGFETFEIPLHIVQDDRQSEDLPFGSRGGIAVPYHFPVAGEYVIRVRLRRQYQDYIMGMGWPQQLDVRLDGRLLQRFEVGGRAPGRPVAASYAGAGEPGFAGDPEWEEYMQVTGDAGLELRVTVPAGPRVVGVSFVRELWEPEGLRQPLQRGRVLTNDQIYMDHAAVGAVDIGGPYALGGAPADTPSQRAIFVCQPAGAAEERACASTILSRIARRAYRRPVTDRDRESLLEFYETGRREGGSFEAGIQYGLERILVDPDFLLRVYREPVDLPQDRETYALSDLEVASRLAFFLWSSIPDDELLDLAERGRLTDPATLEAQARRMLADPRAADALVSDFAAQWLNLRRVGEVVVDPHRYPTYDESLLEAFRRETELFVASTLQEDRSVVELLDADYTFVNERLARHYGIPWRARQPVPAGRAPGSRATRRAAGARRRPGDHVLSRPHVARAARQVAAGQYLWPARAAAAARRRHQPGVHAGRAGADHPRALGAAPPESGLRELPRGDRSAGVRAGELRRDRRLAERGRVRRAGGRARHDGERRGGRRTGRAAGAAAGAARAVSAHAHRKTARVRTRAAPGVLR